LWSVCECEKKKKKKKKKKIRWEGEAVQAFSDSYRANGSCKLPLCEDRGFCGFEVYMGLIGPDKVP
jgi:hypothetical protein